jgi:hypothetical protein
MPLSPHSAKNIPAGLKARITLGSGAETRDDDLICILTLKAGKTLEVQVPNELNDIREQVQKTVEDALALITSHFEREATEHSISRIQMPVAYTHSFKRMLDSNRRYASPDQSFSVRFFY